MKIKSEIIKVSLKHVAQTIFFMFASLIVPFALIIVLAKIIPGVFTWWFVLLTYVFFDSVISNMYKYLSANKDANTTAPIPVRITGPEIAADLNKSTVEILPVPDSEQTPDKCCATCSVPMCIHAADYCGLDTDFYKVIDGKFYYIIRN